MRNQDPILVVVKNHRYDCYGPVTVRSRFLISVLQAQGGVNETVPDGKYHYNIKRSGFRFIESLLPVED